MYIIHYNNILLYVTDIIIRYITVYSVEESRFLYMIPPRKTLFIVPCIN